MGWAKNQMMELQEREDWPNSELADKYVCKNHFEDKYLNEMIDKYGVNGECSYCGKHGTVCDLETFGKNIVWKINSYYNPLDDADLYLADDFYDDDHEIIPGFKKIDCYVVPKELEYYESKEELLQALDLHTDNDDLNEDIASIFTTEQWVSSDFYDEDRRVWYANQWDRFVDTVTHQGRFTFLAMPEFKQIIKKKDGRREDILSILEELINEQKLVRTIKPGTKLYRARKVADINAKFRFDDITSPPNQFAFPNRMSPAGISMFYAAFEKETAMKECVGGDSDGLIVGCFETSRDLRIIDLTSIPEQSFWVNNWQGNQFLHHFNENITKRVNPKDTNHLQYVPTQIFTEYLRYMFKDSHGHGVDGLIFGSSKTSKKNIVLFCNQKDSRNFFKEDVCIGKYRKDWVSI